MHHLLEYDLAPDYLDRRPTFRAAHLAVAKAAQARGELVLAGALAAPADRALLVFAAHAKEAAERFAREDPYVANGLVRSWRVREWATVIGEGASLP